MLHHTTLPITYILIENNCGSSANAFTSKLKYNKKKCYLKYVTNIPTKSY